MSLFTEMYEARDDDDSTPYRWIPLATRMPQWLFVDESSGRSFHVLEEDDGAPMTYRVTGDNYEATQHPTRQEAAAAIVTWLGERSA